MKKTFYFIAILALLVTFMPVGHADAQSCCGYSYGYNPNQYGSVGSPTDVFSFYQYPIPWYTYFQTPNQTATNYYPSNYQGATYTQYQYPQTSYYSQPMNYGNQYNQYGYNSYPQQSYNYGNYGYQQPYQQYQPGGFTFSNGGNNTFAYVQ